MSPEPGPFRLDELVAGAEFLRRNGAPQGYTPDHPMAQPPLLRFHARVAALLALAQAEQAAAGVAGEDAPLGPHTAADDKARLDTLARGGDHA